MIIIVLYELYSYHNQIEAITLSLVLLLPPRLLFLCRQEEADAQLQFGSSVVSAAELKELSWTFYSSELLSALHQMYKQKVCCDVILSAGGFQVSTHKVILMATSDFLKSLITDHESTEEAIHLTGKYSCV